MWTLLGVWIITCVFRPEVRPSWGVTEKVFLVFSLIGLASSFSGVNVWHGLKFWSKKDVYFLIVPFLGVWLRTDAARQRYLRVFWVGGLIAATWGLVTVVAGVNQTDSHHGIFLSMPHVFAHWPRPLQDGLSLVNGRAVGFRSHPLTYAESLILVLSLMLPVLVSSEGRRFLVAAASGWVLLAALVFSQSRGPWLAAIVIMGAIVLVRPTMKTVARLAILVLPALLVFLHPSFRHRAETIVDQHYESNSERLHMWHVGLHVWKEHRLLGIGPGNVKFVVGPYETPKEAVGGPWGHLHDTFINMLVERGVIGLIAFLAWLSVLAGEFWRASRRKDLSDARRRLALTGFLALAGFLISGLTETVYNDEAVLFTLYAVIGLALAAVRTNHEA